MPDAATIAAAFPSCPECSTQLVRNVITGRDGRPKSLMQWRCPNMAVHNVRTWGWQRFGTTLQRAGQRDEVPV